MTKETLYKYPGITLAIIAWIAGFIFFVKDNGEWLGSFWAAGLFAGLVWISYVMIRWLVLSFKSE